VRSPATPENVDANGGCGGAEVFVKRSKRQRTAPRQLKINGVVHFQWNYSRSRREEPSFLVQRYEDFQTVDVESRPPVSILVGCGAETMVDENNPLTPEQMAARIAELESRLAKSGTLSFKVSEKGAVSVYGLGRFPVTLYFEQWIKLLSHIDELRTFMEANKSKLKLKEQPQH